MSKQNSVQVMPVFTPVAEITMISDNELAAAISRLESEKKIVNALGGNPTKWEIELAYLQKEALTRLTRKAKHNEYMKTVPQIDQDDIEDDFDGDDDGDLYIAER